MKPQEEKPLNTTCFTNFEGKFQGRLSHVIPRQFGAAEDSKFGGTSARYECRIKVEYQKDLMGLLEEGMLVAVRNFRQTEKDSERYTLMEISRIWPEHFGLRGLSDHGYYPMQFEIIEQSEADWQTDDKAAMMIQISSIPINYDLTISEADQCKFIKGFSYPLIASEVHILNSQMINRMYNQKITEKLGVDPNKTVDDARKDPRLGLVKMFQAINTTIPIYIDFENLVRYHFGVFAFTGGGKSNLMSNILRRLLLHTEDTKIVIFDISCEYLFLLMDIFADPTIPSKLILETKTESLQQLADSVVKPREYEADTRTLNGFKQVLDLNRVSYYTKPKQKIPTYGHFLDELEEQRKESIGKPHYINAIDQIGDAIIEYMEEHSSSENDEVTKDFIQYVDAKAMEIVETFKVHDKSGLHAWATTRSSLLEVLKKKQEEESKEVGGLTAEKIMHLLEGKERLVCISISDPFTIKELVINLTRDVLAHRKKRFQVKPHVLFVFDEAQEFIPDFSSSAGIDKKCSKQVETLLRQGRKYGLGACIATQRIAYLNTNALQQLHTYFVGTLPRPYDRALISDTFMIDKGILEKTLEFAPGEWLLSSYIATGIENVPIFIKADNAEKEIEKHLGTHA